MMKADAIVVLGCTVNSDGIPSAALSRRLQLAAHAFRAGVTQRIIVSGGRRWGRHIEAEVMRGFLVQQNVPESAVVMELCSLSTAENCTFTDELLRGWGAHRILVATCSWHFPRAARNYRRLGYQPLRPPDAWDRTPPPSIHRRVRERVNTVVDWCMMPRAIDV